MKYKFLIGILIALMCVTGVSAVATKEYSDQSLNDWGSGNFDDVWDLTACDLTLSYTIDMSGQVTGGWTPIEIGLRDEGYPNLDPNDHAGFMWQNWQHTTPNPVSANINDHFLLAKHGWMLDETQYDVDSSGNIVAPFGTYNSYAIWFDRDGVDEWQDDMWQYKDGITYNTGGVYDVVIQYHAVDATTGTMMATINGEAQGFNGNPPALQPVGRSFTGDMAKKMVFFGRGSGGGAVLITDIEVTGCVNRYAEITSPSAGETVRGEVDFEAYLVDEGAESVQWAVRKGTCAAATNTVFGNVDGFTDAYDWNYDAETFTHTFSATADTCVWEPGDYCFIFNPGEGAGDTNIRLTQLFILDCDHDDDGVLYPEDCNDDDAAIYPGADDSNCNGVDENCDGTADDGYINTPTNCGIGACYAAGELTCVSGTEVDTCVAGTPSAEEDDDVDNNCNGQVDEGFCTDSNTVKQDFETITVLPNGATFSTTSNLESGDEYIVEASGTYDYGPSIADAKCSERTGVIYGPGWVPGELLPAPWQYFLQMWIDGSHVSDNWGLTCDEIGHTYATSITGDGTTIDFSIIDSSYTDNSGSLTAKISYCNPDVDDDGVLNQDDMCPDTVADAPTDGLGTNRWVWNGEEWVTKVSKGTGPKETYTIESTYGCSCDQILAVIEDKTDLDFEGHHKYGCSKSILEDWIAGEYYVGPTFVETISVPTNTATPTESVATLETDKDYFLKAYGTADAGDSIEFDAKYSFRTGSSIEWTDAVSTYESYGAYLLDLYVDNTNVDWGAYNEEHIYQIPYEGTGNKLSLHIYDVYYPNNVGNLFVELIEDKWVDLW
ncbi:putative metal-binding motif-containing protein [Candidatus Woesearchaeota archaeon]|nr:putative metal-binding motif-containing protein [Candidatus Woesearchaeota archaeon]